MKTFWIEVLVLLGGAAASFGLFAGMLKLLSMAFHFDFSWALAFGLYLLLIFTKELFNRGK